MPEDFASKFRIPELTIVQLRYWIWSLRPVHCTLGSGILSLARPCSSFGDITPAEASELSEAAREIERRLGSLFRPDKLNYLMLMMVDPHLHFHVIPRYATPREFLNIQWLDGGWPALPLIAEGAEHQSGPLLRRICGALKTAVE